MIRNAQPTTHSDSRLTPASSAFICVHLWLRFLAVLHAFLALQARDQLRQPVVAIR
jgi:hypothetical protein